MAKKKSVLSSLWGKIQDGADILNYTGVGRDFFYVWWLFEGDDVAKYDTLVEDPHAYPSSRGDYIPYYDTIPNKDTVAVLSGAMRKGRVTGTCLAVGIVGKDTPFTVPVPIDALKGRKLSTAIVALGVAQRRVFEGTFGNVDPEALLWRWTSIPYVPKIEKTAQDGDPTVPDGEEKDPDDQRRKKRKPTPKPDPTPKPVPTSTPEPMSPVKINIAVSQHGVGESRETLFKKATGVLPGKEEMLIDLPVGKFILAYRILDADKKEIVGRQEKAFVDVAALEGNLPASFTLELSTLKGWGIWGWQAGRGDLMDTGIIVDKAGNGDTARIPLSAKDAIDGALRVRLFVCQLDEAEKAARKKMRARDTKILNDAGEEIKKAAEAEDKIFEAQVSTGIAPEAESRFVSKDLEEHLTGLVRMLKVSRDLILETPYFNDPADMLASRRADELHEMIDPLIADIETSMAGNGTIEKLDVALATAVEILTFYWEQIDRYYGMAGADVAFAPEEARAHKERIEALQKTHQAMIDSLHKMQEHLEKTLGDKWEAFHEKVVAARDRISRQMDAARAYLTQRAREVAERAKQGADRVRAEAGDLADLAANPGGDVRIPPEERAREAIEGATREQLDGAVRAADARKKGGG